MSAVLRGCGAACVSSRAAVVRSPATRLAGGGARGPRCRVQSRVVRVSSSLAEGQRKVSSIEAAVKLTGEAKEAFVGQLQFGNGKQVEENAMREAMKAAEAGLVEMDMDVGEELLEQAFERCRKVTAEYAKTFYLGTKLMTPDKQRAIWAIYVWCRRTDELVDGPNAARITPEALQRWDDRLEAIFQGKPYDMLDAALSDTIKKFPLSIQPFKDMVDGMRMDLVKTRYETFDELYEYCYRVAGTVGLMSVPVMGIQEGNKADTEEIYKAALGLGLANQLTNILRDVGEDSYRGRIYVPLEDLRKFNISEAEVMKGMVDEKGNVDPRWKEFMKFQIERARFYFKEAEAGALKLDDDARWPVMSALILYAQILDAIEANDYNNFTQRAYVPKYKKLLTLPYAKFRASTAA